MKYVLRDSLLVTLGCGLIIIVCCILSDGFSEPLQVMGGLTSKQIHDSQNITMISASLLMIFIVSVLMLIYLGHGESCEIVEECKRREKEYYRNYTKRKINNVNNFIW